MSDQIEKLHQSIGELERKVCDLRSRAEIAAAARFRMIGGDNRNIRKSYWRKRKELLVGLEQEKRRPTIDRYLAKIQGQKVLLEQLTRGL